MYGATGSFVHRHNTARALTAQNRAAPAVAVRQFLRKVARARARHAHGPPRPRDPVPSTTSISQKLSRARIHRSAVLPFGTGRLSSAITIFRSDHTAPRVSTVY